MASYVVKSGDTLSKIASQYGVKVADITGYRSGNINLIYPGEQLTIGGGSSTPPPTTTPKAGVAGGVAGGAASAFSGTRFSSSPTPTPTPPNSGGWNLNANTNPYSTTTPTQMSTTTPQTNFQPPVEVKYDASDLNSMDNAYNSLLNNARSSADYLRLAEIDAERKRERDRQNAIKGKAEQIQKSGGGSNAMNAYYSSLPDKDKALVAGYFGSNINPNYKPINSNVQQTNFSRSGITTNPIPMPTGTQTTTPATNFGNNPPPGTPSSTTPGATPPGTGPTHTRVTINSKDVSEAIRSMAVNQATSFVARLPEVRRILVEKQRRIGGQLGSLVTEGRDQGSVVFPDADIKFFLDASIDKRSMRRYQELIADGEEAAFDLIKENLEQRDGSDRHQWAPLLEPATAIHIDTTQMTIHEVIERLLEEIRKKKLIK